MTREKFSLFVSDWVANTDLDKREVFWPVWRDVLVSECNVVRDEWSGPIYYGSPFNTYNGSAHVLNEEFPDKIAKIYTKLVLVM